MKCSAKAGSKNSFVKLHQACVSSQPKEKKAVASNAGLSLRMPTTPAETVELTLEAIRQRHEAKTAVLEEALQRTEHFQRFWGINE
jgi:hypothetical protein